jgi:hypothetical protein
MKVACVFLIGCLLLRGDGSGVITSVYSRQPIELTADPQAPHWRVPGIFADKGPTGKAAPGHRTEIRSRWTDKTLHFLFICPYQELYLHPNPSTTKETNKLWEWDVAEVFIGSDLGLIHRYKEFQVSPRGEWVDLDIDRDQPKPEGGWQWNSGFGSRPAWTRPGRSGTARWRSRSSAST